MARPPVDLPPAWRAARDRLVEHWRLLTADDPQTRDRRDEFGFDAQLTDDLLMPLLRPLWDSWFQGQARGLEHLPAGGPALLVANHGGTFPVDGLMLAHLAREQAPAARHLRLLAADLLFRWPVVGRGARALGVCRASDAEATALLDAGHVVGVFPEGFKGIGKTYDERYRLQPFGRGGFAELALRAGVPIIPCAVVGAEESYPLLADVAPLARLLGLPYFPLTPTFPWLGPLGLVPLPARWIVECAPPIDTASLGADAADDPIAVWEVAQRTRDTVQVLLDKLVAERGEPFAR